MPQHLYVTAAEHGSGKSAVALAMMEMLTAHAERVGFFRPVIKTDATPDPLTRLIATRYQLPHSPETLWGATAAEARALLARDRYDELLKRILERYKALEAQCDRVLVTGTDFSGATAALEVDFNADVANNLGCVVLPVVNGHGRDATEVGDAVTSFLQALREPGCEVLAVLVNRVHPELAPSLREALGQSFGAHPPVYVVPEEPSLARPTMGDIVAALGARLVYGDAEELTREVRDYRVAAMLVPDFLDYIGPGSLVITPGDRSDILLATLASYPSTAYPQVSGMVLTGGQLPAAPVRRLIEGLGQAPVAVLGVDTDTFTTAVDVSRVNATLTPENERKVAAALGVMEAHVDFADLSAGLAANHRARMTPLMFEYELVRRAKAERRRIVLPEGTEDRILRAAEILTLRGVADLVLLGDPEAVHARIAALDLKLEEVPVIDPLDSPWRERFAETYYQLRRHKGISPQMAFDAMADVSYFATMMVYHGDADGMVSGSVHTTQHTIRPAFEIIKTRPGSAIISSVFLMGLEDRVLVYGDCAVNPNPDAEQLADIAVDSAATAEAFGIPPRVAMLSYSTGTSGKGEAVDKVARATRLARERRPDLPIEGPIQYDAAVDASVARTKLPESAVAGNATVFVFPDLNTGNNTYKAVQRTSGAVAIGPILQGLAKPVNDLSRGCTVTDIVNTVAITAIQAQGTP
jgi:phosphate acetyltransferase